MTVGVAQTDWKVLLPSKISIFGQKSAFAQFGCTLLALRIRSVGARVVPPPWQFRAKTPGKRCIHPAKSCRGRGRHRENLRGSTTQLTAQNEGKIASQSTVWVEPSQPRRSHEHWWPAVGVEKKVAESSLFLRNINHSVSKCSRSVVSTSRTLFIMTFTGVFSSSVFHFWRGGILQRM